MKTVMEMLHDAAVEFQDMGYLYEKQDEGWIKTSFIEADKQSDTFGGFLLDCGMQPGSRVAIFAEGSPQWIMSEVGSLKARCMVVPLSIKLTPQELLVRLNHSECSAIVVSHITMPKLKVIYNDLKVKPMVLGIGNLKNDESGGDNLPMGASFYSYQSCITQGENYLAKSPDAIKVLEKEISDDDTVTISYTSGTTGNPKGIMLTHRNYFTNATDAVNTVTIPKGSYSTLVILPCDHSFAHTVCLYTGMLRGISLYFVDARGGSIGLLRNIPKNLQEVKPDFLLTVPAITGNFMKNMVQAIEKKGGIIEKIFKRCLETGIARNGDGYNKVTGKPGSSLYLWLAKRLIFPKMRNAFGGNLKFCIGGGAILPVKQQEFFAAIGAPVYQGYGLTENAPIISANSPETHKYGTSGVLMPSIDVKIMLESGVEAPQGVQGEIVVRGGSVMKGYYKNPEATAEALRDGALYSGDLGYMDSDGFLMVVGRQKALLISADGEKYSPEEIEDLFTNHTDVINQIMVYNDHKKYTTGLITLNTPSVEKLFSVHNTTTAQDGLALLKEQLYGFQRDGVSHVPAQWIPRTFRIIEKPFSEEDGLVNSTMKLVRYRVTDYYRQDIEAMYLEDVAGFENSYNESVLKRMFSLT